jgi:hypothetical protein
LCAMSPPDDYHPNTLAVRIEKLGEEIRQKEQEINAKKIEGGEEMEEKKRQRWEEVGAMYAKRGVMLMQYAKFDAAKGDFDHYLKILTTSKVPRERRGDEREESGKMREERRGERREERRDRRGETGEERGRRGREERSRGE